MSILDQHNWAGNNDNGWINSEAGQIEVSGGRKFFSYADGSAQWGQVGHCREWAIAAHATKDLHFKKDLYSSQNHHTDFCFGVRADIGFDIYGSFGVYFASYQNGPLEAFMWDTTSQPPATFKVPIMKSKFYTCEIIIKPDGFAVAKLGNIVLGESTNWGSTGIAPNLYGMLSFSQVGAGVGFAKIDNYKVST